MRSFSFNRQEKNDIWKYYSGFPESWADKLGSVQRQKTGNDSTTQEST